MRKKLLLDACDYRDCAAFARWLKSMADNGMVFCGKWAMFSCFRLLPPEEKEAYDFIVLPNEAESRKSQTEISCDKLQDHGWRLMSKYGVYIFRRRSDLICQEDVVVHPRQALPSIFISILYWGLLIVLAYDFWRDFSVNLWLSGIAVLSGTTVLLLTFIRRRLLHTAQQKKKHDRCGVILNLICHICVLPVAVWCIAIDFYAPSPLFILLLCGCALNLFYVKIFELFD